MSLKGERESIPMSFGRPSTRSPTMLRITSSEPPAIRRPGVPRTKFAHAKVPHSPLSAMSFGPRTCEMKSIDTAVIGWNGVQGDVQSWRVGHGRPWQALCIWSTDAIDTLRAEGHPIGPGFAGENITVSGIPSAAFRPGAHFRIGTVRGFLTSYAIPCKQNNDWFANKDFKRMSHERGDECRLYAMVTTCGTIGIGDTFELFTDR